MANDNIVELFLNNGQKKAVETIVKFMESESCNNLMLLGPGGTGKTTVIVSALTDKYNVAFCAFTNKATQILKTISDKFSVTFNADFMTIHKLLMLEPKYLNSELEVVFKFDKKKLDHVKKYDLIIFDECSTINKELYNFIFEMVDWAKFKFDKTIKTIFLGDFWQLPPIGEKSSIVFEMAKKNGWIISKLTEMMRSKNDKIKCVNQCFMKWIDRFKNINIEENKSSISTFIEKYPYNILPKHEFREFYMNSVSDLIDDYIVTWKNTKIEDCIILTYSKNNCERLNFMVQDIIDTIEDRKIPDNRKLQWFYIGDRCCLDTPIEICDIEFKYGESESFIQLSGSKGEYLYNGEIFDVIGTENIKIITHVNKKKYSLSAYFDAQLLTVKKIGVDNCETYSIIHIPKDTLDMARRKVKLHSSKNEYIENMSIFAKYYPKLYYGYAITVYKSQGSEWNTVFINLNSIKWSIINKPSDFTLSKKKQLLKATYTAASRATSDLRLNWF